jgi:hypothetical protein
MPKLSIKKNTDPYINNVSLFLPFNSNFNDNSSNNFSVTAYGNAQISSTQSKFGGSSAYFDGNGDYLEIGDNNAFELENNDFTIECWFYLTNNTKGYQSILNKSHATADQNGWVLYFETNNSLHFIAGNSFWSIDLNSGVVPTINTWHHVAITRSGNNWRLFYNGDIVASTINNLSFNTGTLPLYIGRYPYFPSWVSTMDFSGYIDDLRITKGIARYTSNFVPRSILPNNDKLQLINSTPFTRDSTYIRNTVLPILRSSITNFYNYSYDGGSSSIDDGGFDMYDTGNRVYLNGVLQSYNTESANTFCYTSYPFIYKTTQTSNFTLSVQGNYGSDGSETKYQYQQDFIHQGIKFSIYISESLDNNNRDPSIVECFIVLYPNSKPTINFTYVGNNNDNGNETISVSNLNGQSVTAFYLLLSNYPRAQIGSATLFDVLKTFVVNCSGGSSFNQKLTISNAYNPLALGDLKVWLDAKDLSTITKDGSNLVSQWSSKVGSINFTQANNSLKPTYQSAGNSAISKDCIYFNAASSYGGSYNLLSSASSNFTSIGETATLFLVARSLYVGSFTNGSIIGQTNGSPFRRRLQVASSTLFSQGSYGDYAGGNNPNLGEVSHVNQPLVLFGVAINSDGTARHYIKSAGTMTCANGSFGAGVYDFNGTLNRGLIGVAGAASNANMLIGSAFGGGQENFKGEICEILIYNGTLNFTAFNKVVDGLTTKWSL